MAAVQDEKFAHLLQPIRDMAENWNINIANELEEYMEVLENITFSFEGGPSLNFAEAALLIQGSACVYSKKVEYLHALVYQALDLFSRRKETRATAAKAGEEVEADEFDEEEHFLDLDDVLEEATGIDLDEDCAALVVPPFRPPATLLALADSSNAAGDGEMGSYRIALCSVHRSGALLLESRDGDLLDENMQFMGVNSMQAARAAEEAVHGSASMQMDEDDDLGGFGGEDDYYHDQDALEGDTTGAQAHGQPAAVEEPAGAEFFDPYKPLDPNGRGSLISKPFKRAARVAHRPKSHALPQEQQPALALDQLLTRQAPPTLLLMPEFGYALAGLAREHAHMARPGRMQGAAAETSGNTAQLASAFTMENAEAGGMDALDAGHDGVDDGDLFGDAFDDGNDDEFIAADDVAFGDVALPEYDPSGTAAGLPTEAGGQGGDGGYDADELTYEELCRAHMDAFITAVAAAEVQTELAARVSSWRLKMSPVLEEEDTRPDFDIHQYGEHLLERLAGLHCEEAGSEPTCVTDVDGPIAGHEGVEGGVPFGRVLAGADAPYDISRSFSSMLQLANSGNVRIIKLEGGQGDFRVALLDKSLPHRQIAAGPCTTAAALDGEARDQHNHVLVETGNTVRGNGKPQAAGEASHGDRPAAKSSKRRKAR